MKPPFDLIHACADRAVILRLAGAAVLVTISAVLNGLAPLALRAVVQRLAGDPQALDIHADGLIVAYVFCLGLARCAGEARALLTGTAEQRLRRLVCGQLYEHLLRLPLRFHLGRRTGEIGQWVESGLQGLQLTLHHLLFGILPAAVELVTICVVVGRLHQPLLLGVFSVAVAGYATLFSYSASKAFAAAKAATSAQAAAMATMVDGLLCVELIKQYTAEKLMWTRTDHALLATQVAWIGFHGRCMRYGLAIALLFALLLGASLLMSAGGIAGRSSVGDFVLVNAYMLQIVGPLELAGYGAQGFWQGRAMLEPMVALMRMETEPQAATGEVPHDGRSLAAQGAADEVDRAAEPRATDAGNAVEGRGADQERVPGQPRALPARDAGRRAWGGGALEFRRVSLAYDSSRPILRAVTFQVPPGGVLGVVGASGSGKSTLLRVLLRLLEPDVGCVLLDGVPIGELSLGELRAAIAVVPQQTVLFDASVAFNIALGRPEATRAEIAAAAQLARVDGVIARLVGGYEASVGEHGCRLSGGERQRLAIARALLKPARVFVFDEATASLDTQTERSIIDDLAAITGGRTTVVMAHRLSTIVEADEILVLEDGAVVERGTHRSLLRADGAYAALWRAQRENRAPS